jgi:glycosyltransferase involved in cell wall biosynthesis
MISERGIIELKVYYTWGDSSIKSKFDPGFGKVIEWDIPLLNGYEYEFLENTATEKGSHHFNGIINPTLIERVNVWKPTSILVFGWNNRSHLSALRYFHKKIPVLFRGDSTLIDEARGFSVRRIFRRVFLRLIYNYIDYALYVGKQNYKYYVAHGLKPNQLVYCPHAIDIDRFANPGEDYHERAKELANKLGISHGATVFLFAGKLEKKKNPSLLLEAFAELNLADTHLVVVGNGHLEVQLKDLAKDLKKIHFLDFQNQTIMPVIYRLADVFVLPSQGPGETWGLAINEAMACGCAILVSRKCGAWEDVVVEGVNGFSFESGDKSDLIDKFTKLINDRSGIDQMKLASKAQVSKFSFVKIASQIENVVSQTTNVGGVYG